MKFEAKHELNVEVDRGRGREGEKIELAESSTLPLSHSPALGRDTRWQADLADLQRALEDGAAGGQPNADVEVARVLRAIGSYADWARTEFHPAHDHFRLLGEDNFRRYLPVEPLRIRIHPDDSLSDIFCRAAAARALNCRAIVSSPSTPNLAVAVAVELLDQITDPWAGAIEFIEEDDEALAAAIRTGQVARIRYAAPVRVAESIRAAAADALQYVADTPVSHHGRIELLWYVREQSVAQVYHRYGNLGIRADEVRDEPL
jgi:RHH-type proline utilization regulon transcriptional repressor/proline dehydrogenase/delta 1-pyrroline-5-carboxylate dehydrogenase